MKKITRRQFLTSAGATSAALLLSSLTHAAAADENCLRKVTPAATNSNALSWDMAEEILTHISDPVFPAYTVNVLDYGAVPNDGKLDTAAIQRAIDETCAHGGCTVVIPSGVYDVGAITLKSNVNLHLESKDTILRFTRDITPANYPLVFAHYEGSKLYNWSPLIYAYQQENIALTGKGTLDGQADKNNWWNWSRTVNPDGTITKTGNKDVKLLRKMTDNGTPAAGRVFGEGAYLRPDCYQPIECTNVLFEGGTIANSPMWELNPVLCTNFTARGVTIDTHGYNNDGCDPENCNYVLIENCFFNTGDDCIAVKAGRNRDGRELGEAGHPTQNLIIRNNTFADGHGGIACGSEMSGGIKNLYDTSFLTQAVPPLKLVMSVAFNVIQLLECEKATLAVGQQGLQFDLARVGSVPVFGHGDEHLLDERRVHDGLLHAAGRSLGDDERRDLLLEFRNGLLAGQRKLGHGVLRDILGLGLRLFDDLFGLGVGLGDDLPGLGLGVGHQLVGLGAPFLQPFVVELLGQLLQFVFHSVILF